MRHRTKQESKFDGTSVTPLPIIKKKRSLEEEENEATTVMNKRPCILEGDQSEYYIPNFFQAMCNLLKTQISSKFSTITKGKRRISLLKIY
jgi:hypothetical protein